MSKLWKDFLLLQEAEKKSQWRKEKTKRVEKLKEVVTFE